VKRIQESEVGRVVAVADPDENARRKLAADFGIDRTCADYEELLRSDVDVVYVCTPHYLHHPTALAALMQGKHVICEKPFALNADQAKEMAAQAAKVGKRIFPAENHRYIAENRKVREIIAGGGIGKPFLCMATFIGDEYERMSDPKNWKGTWDKSGGGVLIDNGPHVFDTVLSFFGRPVSVCAHCSNALAASPDKGEDTAIATLRFGSGVLCEVSLTFVARYCGFPEQYVGAGLRYDVFGENGSAHILMGDPCPVKWVTGKETRLFGQEELEQEFTDVADVHFLECILDGKEPLVTSTDGIQVMSVIDACYRSAKSGQAERL